MHLFVLTFDDIHIYISLARSALFLILSGRYDSIVAGSRNIKFTQLFPLLFENGIKTALKR